MDWGVRLAAAFLILKKRKNIWFVCEKINKNLKKQENNLILYCVIRVKCYIIKKIVALPVYGSYILPG